MSANIELVTKGSCKHERSQVGTVWSQVNEDNREEKNKIEDEVEEDEGETRCVCEEVEPPDAFGLYIQCENCAVWQHGYCVGISEGKSMPDKYWCEECKPELHSLHRNEAGQMRSNYKPVNQRQKQNKRVLKRGGDQPSTTQHEVTVKDENTCEDDENVISQRKESMKNYKAVAMDQEDMHSGSDFFHSIKDDEKRLINRTRATISAREEKHYQLMLEKAIQESRRTPHSEVTLEIDEENDLSDKGMFGSDTLPPTSTSTTSVGTYTVHPTSKQDYHKSTNFEDPILSNNLHSILSITNTTTRKRTKSKSSIVNSSLEDDRLRMWSKRIALNKGMGNTSQRSPTETDEAGFSAKTNTTKVMEIGIKTPIKPRLPSRKTTLSEMRRRISAILEFLSRTHTDFSQDEASKKQLLQFVENDEFVTKINSIFQDYRRSLVMMDCLTRKLLLWEQKYSFEDGSTY